MKINRATGLMLCGLAAVLAGCAQPENGGLATVTQPDAAAALGASRWDLVEWTGQTLPDGRKLRLDFDPTNGRFSSSTTCNRVMGGYRAEGSTLSMGAGRGTMASTMMACPEPAMAMERAYVDALTGVRSFSLTGDRLTLNSANGVALTYRGVHKPAAAAPRKFIYVSAETRPCTGVAPMTCLQVREKEDDPWQLFYGSIDGFQFEPGIEYRLRIIEEKVDNPPADASSIRWTLDQVIEQRVVKPTR